VELFQNTWDFALRAELSLVWKFGEKNVNLQNSFAIIHNNVMNF
jgi:hypothetical protein